MKFKFPFGNTVICYQYIMTQNNLPLADRQESCMLYTMTHISRTQAAVCRVIAAP